VTTSTESRILSALKYEKDEVASLFTNCLKEVFPDTEGMYMYTALNRNGSGTYHGGKHPGALLFENLWDDRWGKGKEE
jgi:hypothetical protein